MPLGRLYLVRRTRRTEGLGRTKRMRRKEEEEDVDSVSSCHIIARIS